MLTPVGRKIVCLLKEERKKTILDYVWERFVKGWGLTTAHRLPIAERERRENRICQILSNFSPVAFRRRRERLRHHLRFGRRRPTSADSPSQTPDSGRRHHHQRVGHGIVRNGEGDYGPISSLARIVQELIPIFNAPLPPEEEEEEEDLLPPKDAFVVVPINK